MRILLLPSLYIPNIGGIETFTRDLALALISKGHSVIILTKKWPSELVDEEEIDGIKVYRIFSAKTKDHYLDMNKWLKENKNKFIADIIHVIGVRRCLPIAGITLSKEMNIPIVMTIAGSEVPQEGDSFSKNIWNKNKKIIEYACKSSNAVTSFSKGLRNNILKVLPDIKVDVIYAGIELSLFNNVIPFKHNKGYILSARRLSYDKGIDILIDSFSQIHKKYDIELIVVGDGPELENLKLQVDKLNLLGSVKFFGSVTIEKLAQLLSGAILTVVPSRCEGGGLINIEAQAVGCPVVASNIGGISEYIKNGYSGILVPPEDSKKLAYAIEQILSNNKIRNKLIKNGKDFSLNFDFNLIKLKYIDFYQFVINSFNINNK